MVLWFMSQQPWKPKEHERFMGRFCVFLLRHGIISNNCDPTRVNEADVVYWPKWDFANNMFYMSLGSFDTKIIVLSFSILELWENQNCFLDSWDIRNQEIQVLSPEIFHFVNKLMGFQIKQTMETSLSIHLFTTLSF